MMSLEEIQLSAITEGVAREAYTQVDRYLSDILAIRDSFEEKAATLMGAYITVSLALFGIGATMLQRTGSVPIVCALFGTGMVFLTGAWCFIHALKAGTYGGVGSTPEMWLTKGVIDAAQTRCQKCSLT